MVRSHLLLVVRYGQLVLLDLEVETTQLRLGILELELHLEYLRSQLLVLVQLLVVLILYANKQPSKQAHYLNNEEEK